MGPEIRPADDRPQILVTADLAATCEAAVEALAGHGRCYVGPTGLCEVVEDPRSGWRMHPLSADALRETMAQAAQWASLRKTKEDDWEEVPCAPPVGVARAVRDRGSWPDVPVLDRIADTPVLRPDGTVLQDAGYDAEMRLLYHPTAHYPRVPDDPSEDQVSRSLARLLDVVVDFPFATPADRSAWLAVVLTLLGRNAIDGLCPALLVGAAEKGSGKSKLAELAGIIAIGRTPSMRIGLRQDEGEELRKYIAATVASGQAMAVLDNVVGRVGWPALDGLLTSGRLDDRILGSLRKIDCEVRTVWVITANNADIAADISRRCLSCHLLPESERPWERSGWAHPRITDYVRQHRAVLAVDALTILRAYVVAGRPAQGISAWGSYETWSDLIREAIVWAGEPDPADARGRLEDADSAATLLGRILAPIWDSCRARGLHAAEIWAAAQTEDGLRAALEELCAPSPPTPVGIGVRLRRYRDRWADGYVLRCGLDARSRSWVYRVER